MPPAIISSRRKRRSEKHVRFLTPKHDLSPETLQSIPRCKNRRSSRPRRKTPRAQIALQHHDTRSSVQKVQTSPQSTPAMFTEQPPATLLEAIFIYLNHLNTFPRCNPAYLELFDPPFRPPNSSPLLAFQTHLDRWLLAHSIQLPKHKYHVWVRLAETSGEETESALITWNLELGGLRFWYSISCEITGLGRVVLCGNWAVWEGFMLPFWKPGDLVQDARRWGNVWFEDEDEDDEGEEGEGTEREERKRAEVEEAFDKAIFVRNGGLNTLLGAAKFIAGEL